VGSRRSVGGGRWEPADPGAVLAMPNLDSDAVNAGNPSAQVCLPIQLSDVNVVTQPWSMSCVPLPEGSGGMSGDFDISAHSGLPVRLLQFPREAGAAAFWQVVA
jgi:hypothetical protein